MNISLLPDTSKKSFRFIKNYDVELSFVSATKIIQFSSRLIVLDHLSMFFVVCDKNYRLGNKFLSLVSLDFKKNTFSFVW